LLLTNSAQTSTAAKKDIVCYWCGIKGHCQNECRKKHLASLKPTLGLIIPVVVILPLPLTRQPPLRPLQQENWSSSHWSTHYKQTSRRSRIGGVRVPLRVVALLWLPHRVHQRLNSPLFCLYTRRPSPSM